MIRAVIFDFFSVIIPEIYEPIIDMASEISPELGQRIKKEVYQYYLGIYSFDDLMRSFEIIFRTKEIPIESLKINKSEIPTEILDIAKELHMHFLKVSIIGNIGQQELDILSDFDKDNHEFELIAGPVNFGEPLLTDSFFEDALRVIGEPPQNCLLVSGNKEYIDFINSIGMKSIFYSDYDTFRRKIQELM